jgi:Tol biopolymer transport system component
MATHAMGAEAINAGTLQASFNQKFQTFFGADSTSLLPLPAIDKQDWKRMRAHKALHQVYQEPGKYYNSKVYVFTLYQDDDDGAYYLDATGGFWGMDELVYGPLSAQDIGIP